MRVFVVKLPDGREVTLLPTAKHKLYKVICPRFYSNVYIVSGRGVEQFSGIAFGRNVVSISSDALNLFDDEAGLLQFVIDVARSLSSRTSAPFLVVEDDGLYEVYTCEEPKVVRCEATFYKSVDKLDLYTVEGVGLEGEPLVADSYSVGSLVNAFTLALGSVEEGGELRSAVLFKSTAHTTMCGESLPEGMWLVIM